MASVKIAQAHQPAEHVRQVAAEHTPVGMDLVNDDIAQVLKQFDPLGMMRQDAGVQHVRVGNHDMAGLPHGLAGSGGRVPVIGIGFDIHAHALDHVIQFADLIRGQGLGREKIERAGVLVLQNGGQHRQVIAHGFAGSGGRDHGHVLSPGGGLQALCLVSIQAVDAAFGKHRNQPGIQAVRERGRLRRPGRNNLPPGDVLHEVVVPPELVRKLRHVHYSGLL